MKEWESHVEQLQQYSMLLSTQVSNMQIIMSWQYLNKQIESPVENVLGLSRNIESKRSSDENPTVQSIQVSCASLND